MNEVGIFIAGIVMSVVVCFLVVGYLKSHLQKILVDICGNEMRANFWMAFSNVTLILIPTIFAMSYRPRPGDNISIFFELSTQFKWGLIGLASSVIVLGIVIRTFIQSMPPLKQQ